MFHEELHTYWTVNLPLCKGFQEASTRASVHHCYTNCRLSVFDSLQHYFLLGQVHRSSTGLVFSGISLSFTRYQLSQYWTLWSSVVVSGITVIIIFFRNAFSVRLAIDLHLRMRGSVCSAVNQRITVCYSHVVVRGSTLVQFTVFQIMSIRRFIDQLVNCESCSNW